LPWINVTTSALAGSRLETNSTDAIHVPKI
jgi:hypothetical protein